MTLEEFLKKTREEAYHNADLGRKFEKFIRQYLLSKAYAGTFTDVWLWGDFPYWKGHDVGIDLVARDTFGEFTAVQCKCYRPGNPVSKENVDTFLSASGKSFQVDGHPTRFSQRLLVSTNDNWSAHAEDAIENQNPPVTRIGLAQLRQSIEAAGGFDFDTMRPTVRKFSPKPHQERAIRDVLAGFAGADRGQLVMACGTGKTYTSLRIAEELHCKTVLVLVPSISLLAQSLRVWAAQAREEIATLAVCSDSKADREEGDISVCDLGFPATTSPGQLVLHGKALKMRPPKGMTVVFSTYQSIDAVGEAQKSGAFGTFDLIVCDEAHRTTGAAFEGTARSSFTKVHDDACVKGCRRLYMTATPRVYGENAKKKAEDEFIALWSMDDEAVYGREFHHLSFSSAVAQDLLSDYKVEVLAVAEKDIRELGLKDWDGDGTIDNVEDVGKWIGCWKAFNKRLLAEDMQHLGTNLAPMRSVVAFSSSIRESRTFARGLNAIAETFAGMDGLHPAKVHHVDGTMNALVRSGELDWLRRANEADNTECRILSNAKCLSEGVDVPGLDAIAFLSPKNSFVEVVQAIGRVMRKAPGKQFGYVVIPVVIPEGLEPDAVLSDNKRFKVVWDILAAIRSHDDGFHTLDNKVDIVRIEPPSAKTGRPEPQPLPPPPSIPAELFGEYQKAIKAKLAKVCGERKYWSTWATEVAEVVRAQIARIHRLLERPGNPHEEAFRTFLEGLRANLNPTISKDDAIEMLAQQLVSAPIFSAVFGDFDFVAKNPVSQSLAPILQRLDEGMSTKDRAVLETFQQSVRNKAAGHTTSEQKQHIIIELYNNFFNIAFKDAVEKLGIVYTPIPCVDFILHSVAALLRKHFDKNIGDKGVHILDPFTGTGTFPVRLLQSGLIPPGDLARKYVSEIHTNEIVLLAYYIAAINIEAAYHDLAEKASGGPVPYRTFDGIVLSDTFQLGEKQRRIDSIFPENSRRAQKQNDTPITGIVGNPPYSIGQKSANDDAKNVSYPLLDKRITDTYAQGSKGKLRKSLYDSYVRAFRWATDRLGEEGIVAFISNARWLDNKAMNGFRLTLQKEFSHVYVFDLRGNCNTKGEQRRREGGGVFGIGSQTPVTMTILVKTKKESKKLGSIHYHDIGDFLSSEEKLKLIEQAHDVDGTQWDTIIPDKHNDWLNQRNKEFDEFIPLGPKKNKSSSSSFFVTAPIGVSTNRDVWVYNFSAREVLHNMDRSAQAYHSEMVSSGGDPEKVHRDASKIIWTAKTLQKLAGKTPMPISKDSIRIGSYRPFCAVNLYYDRNWLERPGTWDFVREGVMDSPVICVGGNSTDKTPDLHFCGDVHCFQLYWYERIDGNGSQFTLPGLEPAGRYLRHEGISDFIQHEFEKVLGTGIPKKDIFYWVYGALHSPRYRETFAADLKKQLPRLPLPEDRPSYERVLRVGRELARLHLHYEEVEPWPLDEVVAPGRRCRGAWRSFASGRRGRRKTSRSSW